MPSNPRLINTKVSALVVIANNSSSGDHFAALIPASTEPTISIRSSCSRGEERTIVMSPPAKTRQVVWESAKWWREMMWSHGRSGLGEGASQEVINVCLLWCISIHCKERPKKV